MNTHTLSQISLFSQRLPTLLHAQSCDTCRGGFYFKTVEEFNTQARRVVDSCSGPVEKFTIQFVEGNIIDSTLFKVLGIDQGNFDRFLEVADKWSEDEKIKVIIHVRECGRDFDFSKDEPKDLNIKMYRLYTTGDLADANALGRDHRIIMINQANCCVYRHD